MINLASIPEHIQLQALTKESFASFGDVVQCENEEFFHINGAHTERYHALSITEAEQAKIGISIFRNIQKTSLPLKIEMLEKHPLGSQAFIPMHGQSFIIVVAPALNALEPDLTQIKAFLSNGSQGVNYHQNTWHHPLLTLEAPSSFVVIDRIGQGKNCDVYHFKHTIKIHAS